MSWTVFPKRSNSFFQCDFTALWRPKWYSEIEWLWKSKPGLSQFNGRDWIEEIILSTDQIEISFNDIRFWYNEVDFQDFINQCQGPVYVAVSEEKIYNTNPLGSSLNIPGIQIRLPSNKSNIYIRFYRYSDHALWKLLN